MSDDLVAWLREQIEARKRTASVRVLEPGAPWRLDGGAWDAGTGILSGSGRPAAVAIGDYAARHIVASDPRDAIARCDAELAILDGHATEIIPGGALPTHYWCQTCHVPGDNPGRTWCRTVRLLASGYQHRPGYRGEWRP